MGRLTLRAAFGLQDIEFVQINDPAGNAETLAYLLKYDSVRGTWSHDVTHDDNNVIINGQAIRVTQNKAISGTDWSECDLVIEASGKMKKTELLQADLDQGVKKIVVTAPVKEEGVLNVVMGVNDHQYDVEAQFDCIGSAMIWSKSIAVWVSKRL